MIRISGGHRYETAVQVGELVVSVDQSGTSEASAANPVIDTAVVTIGSDYPDALSVASFAGQKGLPILFTATDELNELTGRAMSRWGIKNVIIVGGNGVVSTKVENILRNEMNLNVTRLNGANRYLTGLEIAKHFAAYSTDSGSTVDSTGRQTDYPYAALATGNNFPDALAGAALAAKLKMPILLTGKEQVSPQIRDYLQEANLKKLYVFGGRAIITDNVLEEVSRKD